jgi:hypothetical protein
MSIKLHLIIPFLALLFISSEICAQDISGVLSDTSNKKNISNAVVALMSLPDTILYKFTRTNIHGNFTIKNAAPGQYLLLATHPYYADYLDKIEVKNENISLKQIAVINKSKLLQEVIVRSGSPIKIKGDTTVYTADSFKVSANADVEELLKKLPGITVDKNGTITAMGETVSTVLVDGEEFFGDDPGMAVKNLRADAVKEVQVFDKKSEQATFTGIDDGKTDKTINLKLKDDRKKGYFGKIDLTGGTVKDIDKRYNSNLMLSSFKGKRKISGYFLTGNTGQNGLNWQDNDKYGGSDDRFSIDVDEASGGFMFNVNNNSDDEPYVNTENGFTKNINAGFQYSNKWNEKHNLNFSPKYNDQVYTNNQNLFSKTILGDSSLNFNQNTNSNVERYNIKTNLTYEFKIDSLNSFKIANKINSYNTKSTEYKKGETIGESGSFKNSALSSTDLTSEKKAISGNAIYRHKFKKDRRTFSLYTTWAFIHSNGNSFLKSQNVIFADTANSVLTIDQNKMSDKGSQSFSGKVSYTEPLSKRYTIEIANEISANNGKNNQTVNAYNASTGKYDYLVDSLTNNFNQNIFTTQPSVKLSYNKKKIKLYIGSGVGFTHFNLSDISYRKNYLRNYVNYFPSANLTFDFKANRHVRINYDGSTTQPTINQLQPLRNNDDYFNQYLGNTDLKPSFKHNLNLSTNKYDFIKDKWSYISVNFSATQNSITNKRIINTSTGKTINQPINTDGNYSVEIWSGIGYKIKKADLRFNMNPNLDYSRFKDVINGSDNFAKTLSAGIGLSLSKSKEKAYDCWINTDFKFNKSNTTEGSPSQNYITNSLYADATIYYKKVWSINSRYENHYRQKTIQTQQNLNANILNAKLQRTFKKDEFTAYITVIDLLNQNKGVDMSYYSNTYTVTTNSRLQRYWMIGFVWNFKNKTAEAKH